MADGSCSMTTLWRALLESLIIRLSDPDTGPVSGELAGTAAEAAARAVPVSSGLSACRPSLLEPSCPAGDISLPHGRPTASPVRATASVGVSTFRVCEMRPDWAPSISRGGGVLPGGMQIRPAPAAFQRPALHPAVASHRQGFSSRDVIEGSRVFARPVFPLPVATGWNGGAWASPRSFAPRRYQRRTSRWERIIGHGPGTTLTSATSPTPFPRASTQHSEVGSERPSSVTAGGFLRAASRTRRAYY